MTEPNIAVQLPYDGVRAVRAKDREAGMDQFMQMAIEEAKATKAEGGSPFGAVLVRGDEVHRSWAQYDDPA